MSNTLNPRNADFVMCFKVEKYCGNPKYKTFMKSILKNTKKTNGSVDFSYHLFGNIYEGKKLMSVKRVYEIIDDLCNTADLWGDDERKYLADNYEANN